MARLKWRRQERSNICCDDCGYVMVPRQSIRLLVCIEDNWHSLLFTCPKCKIGRVNDIKESAVSGYTAVGIEVIPWSVQDDPCPIIRQPQKDYRPRVTPRSYLPFDEVDVAHLRNDMDSRDWFRQLLEQER